MNSFQTQEKGALLLELPQLHRAVSTGTAALEVRPGNCRESRGSGRPRGDQAACAANPEWEEAPEIYPEEIGEE